MKFDVLTLFPDMFTSYLKEGILGRAIERGLVDVALLNIRDFAKGLTGPLMTVHTAAAKAWS
jgi:tRNA (guanine37-N1)-methyltransferase